MSVKRLEPDCRGIAGSYSDPIAFTDYQQPWALVDYAAENDFELIIMFDWADFQAAHGVTEIDLNLAENYILPCAEHCQDAHVNYWFNIEQPLSQNFEPITDKTTPTETYETKCGPLLDMLETEPYSSTYLQGYQFEGVFDIGLEWLRARGRFVDRDDLRLSGVWNSIWPHPGTGGTLGEYGPYRTSDFRLRLYDEISCNMYSVKWDVDTWPTLPFKYNNIIELFNYDTSNPSDDGEPYTMPLIGVQVGIGIMTGVSATGTLWGDTWHDETQPPIADQMKRAAYYTNYIKEATGLPFENTNYWLSGYFISPTPHWEDIINFFESLNLLGAATRGCEAMSQAGLTPYYTGAAICTHGSASAIETFSNTGNELILLKNYTGSATHDITVTSSLDPLTNSPYTLDLSPYRGTIIGPYPLDEYGALPTIEYDNTNLYVSVLKVEPTA